MTHSESIANLAAALSAAQGQYPAIPRNKTVRIRTKAGGEYTFQYAPLDVILTALRPVLAANGLAVVQDIEEGSVSTMILHSSGEWWRGATVHVPPDEPGAKAAGSALTYAQRYSLRAALNVATDDDDDATTAAGDHIAVKAPESPQDAPTHSRASQSPEPTKSVNAEGSGVNAGASRVKGADVVLTGSLSTAPEVRHIQVKGVPQDIAEFHVMSEDVGEVKIVAWHDARDYMMSGETGIGALLEIRGRWDEYKGVWKINANEILPGLPF